MKAATGLLILALGAASAVWAADGSGASAPTASPPASATVKQLTPQQEKMKSCNADAKTKSLTGDARKTFMKSCLSDSAAAATTKQLTPQQEKMKSCNADAKTKALTGDARKTFMKTCLKAS